MIKRAYCIVCGHLHRRDPKTWTDRACCKCGGEVRFSGGKLRRERLTITVHVRPDDLALLGPLPDRELAKVISGHLDRLHRRFTRRDLDVELELERRPIMGARPWGRRRLKSSEAQEISTGDTERDESVRP